MPGLSNCEVNPTIAVHAGSIGRRLEAEPNTHGQTLNHSPVSLDRSAAGGWLATRATGSSRRVRAAALVKRAWVADNVWTRFRGLIGQRALPATGC